VVLNLKQATAYKAQLQGKSLLVTLDPVAGAAGRRPATAQFAENRNRDTQPIKDLDFRRGPDSTGRVIVDLPNNQVGVDIRQQGQSLVVEFLKSTLPEGLRRRLDVSDFGTPVQTVTTQQAGDRVRMTIEPKGEWEHSAYQSDNQFVVEVRQQKVDPTKLTQGGYNGEKLSLNFQNIEVRSLLQVIADFTNFNIVTSDSVTGALTLRLKDVPWDQALDIILQAKGLGMRKSGNVLWIAPKDEIAAKEKLELESRAAIQNLEPLRTQAFQLNYTKAPLPTGPDAAHRVRGPVAPRPHPEPARQRHRRTAHQPALRVRHRQPPGAGAGTDRKLDIAVRQVLIEARIVEASDTFGKSLGVRLGGGDLRASATPVGGTSGTAFGASGPRAPTTAVSAQTGRRPRRSTTIRRPS
jgi:type IV pilus assembly protein PilQ